MVTPCWARRQRQSCPTRHEPGGGKLCSHPFLHLAGDSSMRMDVLRVGVMALGLCSNRATPA